MKWDLLLKPEWRKSFDKIVLDPETLTDGLTHLLDQTTTVFPLDREEAKSWVRGSMEAYECPFAWLLDLPFEPISN